jgi:Tol biopolymer transport system component
MDTDPGTFMGTVGYLSPEQAKALEVDTRSDLFSLGVVLYEMIAGQNPFNRGAFREVIEAILKTEPAPLTDFAPKTPASLQKIVTRALSKDKLNRYQHTEDLLADLKTVQAQFQQAKPRKLTPRERWLRVGIGLIVLIAIASLGFVVIRMVNRSRNAASDLSARLTYIDIQSWKSERGEGPINARFSHDGQMIAFTRTGNRQVNIWVKQALPGAEPRQLMIGTSHNAFPIWSPDDQQIAFVSTREGRTGIWSIPVNGGPETFLSPLESSTARTRAWSKDGKTIYYEVSNNLFALDVATRAATQVTQFSTKAPYRGRFSFAPAEDRICYVEVKNGRSDIWVASLHGESPFNVTDDDAEDHSPTWHPDGKRIVYTSDRGGVVQICVAYIDGSKPTQITSSAANHSVTDVSSDGTRLLDDNSRDDAAIFAIDVNTGRESEVASGSSQKLWPTVSPDGAFVLFQSVNPTGTILSSLILVKRTTNQGPIAQIAENGFDPTWSPDGNRIAFLRLDASKVELFTVRSSGEDQRRLTNGGVVPTAYNLLPSIKFGRNFCWSPQSDKIIYSSRKSGVSNLWAVSVDGATDTQITDNNDPAVFLYEPLCGADDRIAFASENRRGGNFTWSLWVRDNNKTEVILEEKSLLRPIAWSATGSELVVGFTNKASQKDPTAVRVSSCSTEGACHSLASLTATYFWTVAVAPDGRTIAFVSSSDGSDNIWRSEITGRGVQRLTSNNDPKVYFPGLNWSADSQSIYYGKQTSVGLITMIDNFD